MAAVRLELVVLSYNGQALPAPLSRALDGPVSIGRGSDNDLPLNDPERLISRQQARLVLGPAGTVDICNLSSSSSLFINGSELAPGRSCTMSPSDQLLVGRYVLGLRPASLPGAVAAPPAAAQPAVSLYAMPQPASSPASAAAVAPAAPRATPRAQPVQPVQPAAPMAARARPAQVIPDDFDVFAAPPAAQTPFGLPAADVSIEDLGEKAAAHEVFSELQALGGDVLAEPDDEARRRARLLDTRRESLDPLQVLDVGAERAGASAALDHGLEIDSLFVLPSVTPEAGRPAAPVAPVVTPRPPEEHQPGSAAQAERMMADLLGSGPALDPLAAITNIGTLPPLQDIPVAPPSVRVVPAKPAAAPVAASPVNPASVAPPNPAAALRAAIPAAAAAIVPAAVMPTAPEVPPAMLATAAAPMPAPPPVSAPASASAPVASAAGGATDTATAAALRTAFARGCGIDVNHVSEFTPQALEMLGRLVAAMAAGTIRLMHGRSSTKHEMRANVTIIATDGNNPLKFAPDGAAALTQLLGRGSPGFMPPLRAVEDAFDDLSAHQVGLLAGSRAAMYDVAQMLGPERFLARAGQKSGLESLMPAKHKARLWDLYENGYQEMVGAAREEFENLFQRAFARAYEQEIERINAGKNR